MQELAWAASLDSLNQREPAANKIVRQKLRDLLAATSLPEMIHKVHHGLGDNTVTHTLPPTDLIRLIHSHNRTKFGQIFTADPVFLEGFWRDLFDSEDGRDFQQLHPGLRNRTPEDLRTSIPTVIHEDAAPYGKKRSVNVLQWGPLFVNGSDIESRFIHHGYISKQAEPAEIGRPPWEKFWEEVEYMVERS